MNRKPIIDQPDLPNGAIFSYLEWSLIQMSRACHYSLLKLSEIFSDTERCMPSQWQPSFLFLKLRVVVNIWWEWLLFIATDHRCNSRFTCTAMPTTFKTGK